MRCPEIDHLPEPPPGKTGWPWTEESTALPSSDRQKWPRITVITPSFNQAIFIEETIRSVLLQGYPDLEYIVLDGGSTDGSVEIIKKYSRWMTYWVSEADGGQSSAINRGLRIGSGIFATWINSDDMLCRNALVAQVPRYGLVSNTVYVGICTYIDETGKPLSSHQGSVHSLEDLLHIRTIWRSRGHIVQPEVLFPRELALAVGGLDPSNQSTMDYELWGKFFLKGAKFQYTDIPFGMFREHRAQKTHDILRHTQSLVETAAKLTTRSECLSEKAKSEILAELDAYNAAFRKAHWRGTGRLAKIGLPPSIVNPIRDFRRRFQTGIDD